MTPSTAFCIVSGAWLFSGISALFLRDPGRSRIAGFGGGAAASLLGLVFVLGGFFPRGPVRISIPAPLPWVESELFIDGLSAFFLGIVFLLGLLTSLYAVGYMREYDGRRRGRAAPLFFNLLLLSMALVVSAGDMLTFLLAWEGMGLSSYFLVVFEHDRAEVASGGADLPDRDAHRDGGDLPGLPVPGPDVRHLLLRRFYARFHRRPGGPGRRLRVRAGGLRHQGRADALP